MSTICKVDPTVRRARATRRQLQHFFHDTLRMIRHLPVPAAKRPEIADFVLHAVGVIDTVIADPRRTGEQKNAICSRIATEWRDLNGAQPDIG
jgi:hypothetical protein